MGRIYGERWGDMGDTGDGHLRLGALPAGAWAAYMGRDGEIWEIREMGIYGSVPFLQAHGPHIWGEMGRYGRYGRWASTARCPSCRRMGRTYGERWGDMGDTGDGHLRLGALPA